MNYYTALELERDGKPTGLFHYICQNKRTGVYALGYCATNEAGEKCPGHHDKESARAHYKKYLLDTNLRFQNPTEPDEQRKCEQPDCGVWTSGSATIPVQMRHWDLCPAHQTREVVETLFDVGDSWGT